MATQRAFGRRIDPQKLAAPAEQPAGLAAPAAVGERTEDLPSLQVTPLADELLSIGDSASIEDELREWKRTRHVRIPWSQLSLMASLCFGIGSFVLPDSVNSGAEWLLWGLSAASAYVWFTNRRAKARARAIT